MRPAGRTSDRSACAATSACRARPDRCGCGPCGSCRPPGRPAPSTCGRPRYGHPHPWPLRRTAASEFLIESWQAHRGADRVPQGSESLRALERKLVPRTLGCRPRRAVYRNAAIRKSAQKPRTARFRIARPRTSCLLSQRANLDRKPDQIDEAECILLVVLRAHREARDVQRIERMRRLAARRLDVALIQAQRHLAGRVFVYLREKRVQRFAQRCEPQAVVNHLRIIERELLLEVRRSAIER